MQQPPPQYAFQHDALALVADPVAQAQLGNVAPAIHAGEVIDDARLEEAIVEKRRRKAHERAEAGVTRREVTAARKRELAIMLEHCAADNQAPIGGHPAWFTAAIRQGLEPLENQVTMLERQVANLEALADIRVISIRSTGDPTQMRVPLPRLVREHQQLGPCLPRSRHTLGALVVGVGDEIPSPPFPDTLADVRRMIPADINRLAMLLHTDFGIAQEDSVEERRNKVRLFFLHSG
ncbi:hypothetical protein PHYBOEH_006973 [Phytophthora boehmeriae]|uniref:Uncharacterized protein n=1 Tax=Phytophthora boehmeriae TaxID=109152 RepID=A0A8T1WF16_9STRA|nr:hypothetical protein PHYBOEH_006973 [Phytophthora boehmeriae]